MTPQELKNSIIHLAIRGRLVEQRTEEGSAEELYSLIQVEKKSKGINDSQKMEPITEDIIPYDIPDNWRWVRFGDIVDYKMGKTPPRAEALWWKPEYPWVSIADMPENGHITSTKESVSMNALSKKFGNKVSQAGTIIMSFKLTVGRVSILDIDAVHNEAIISIYPFCDDDKTIQSYLFKLLPTVTQYGDTKNAIKGKTLNDTSICNLFIPLPPLAEQKRIVAKIEELLPYIDRYEKAWRKLEDFNKRFPTDMQKSILQTAIQGKLVEQRPEEGTADEFYQQIQNEKQQLIKAGIIKKEKGTFGAFKDEETPFEIPESWLWVRFGSIMINRDAERVPLSSLERQQLEKIYDYYGASGVIDKVDRFLFDKKLLLIGEDGANLLARSTPIAFLAQGKYWVNNHAHVLDCNEDLLCMEYVMYYINAINLAKYVTGTAQPKMNQEKMNSIPVALPPLAEQKRIVAKIEELLPLCGKLKK